MPKKPKIDLDSEEYAPDFLDWNPDLVFKQREACELLNREVVKKENRGTLPNPPLEAIGFIVGVLSMNEEIEVLVKFDNDIEQVIKAEFCAHYVLVPEL